MTGSGSTPPPAREETRCRNRQDHFTPAIDGLAPLHPLHWPVERTPSRLPGAPSHPAASLQWSSASGGRRRSSTGMRAAPPFPVTDGSRLRHAVAQLPHGLAEHPLRFRSNYKMALAGTQTELCRALVGGKSGRRPPRPRIRSATPCLALSAARALRSALRRKPSTVSGRG